MPELLRKPIRRFRPRISLKWLMILTSTLGLSLGILVRRAQDQESAVRAIGDAGGTVYYDWSNRSLWFGQDMSEPPESWWLRDRLGPHYFDRVVEVHLRRSKAGQASDELAEAIQALPRLKSLDTVRLDDVTLDRDFAVALGRCRRLEVLKGEKARVCVGAGEELRRATRLRTVELRECRVDSEVFESLAKLPNLKRLWLEEVRVHRRVHEGPSKPRLRPEGYIRDDTLIALSRAKNVEQLAVLRSDATDDGLRALAGLRELRFLNVTTAKATTAPLEDLASLTHLEELFISGWQVRDDDLRHLTKLSSLRALYVRGTGIFEETVLGVQPSSLGAEGLRHIGKLKELQTLEIGSDRLGEADIVPLFDLHRLRQLDLTTRDLSPTGLAANKLRLAFPGRLKIYQSFNPSGTDSTPEPDDRGP